MNGKLEDHGSKEMNMDKKELARRYEQGINIFQHELDLLFRRLNFFLLATSFVVAAFAVLIAYSGPAKSNLVLAIAYLVLALGWSLSIVFTIVNYINSKVVDIRAKYAEKVRESMKGNIEQVDMNDIGYPFDDDEQNIHPVDWLKKDFWKDCCSMLTNPLRFAQGNKSEGIDPHHASHTWFIPLGFSLFWVLAAVLLAVFY